MNIWVNRANRCFGNKCCSCKIGALEVQQEPIALVYYQAIVSSYLNVGRGGLLCRIRSDAAHSASRRNMENKHICMIKWPIQSQ